MKKSNLKEKLNFLLLLKSAYVKIATMFIVAILVFFQWGFSVAIPCFLVTAFYFALTVAISDKTVPQEEDCAVNKKDIYVLLVYFLAIVILTVFICLLGQSFLYSITTAFALVFVLIPITKRYSFYVAAFLRDKNIRNIVDYRFYKSVNSAKCISVENSNMFSLSQKVSGYATSYLSVDEKNVDYKDYAYKILGELALISCNDMDCFSSFKNYSVNYKNAEVILTKGDRIKYTVIKNKNGYRAIAYGQLSDILSVCSESVGRNSLVKIDKESEEKIVRNCKFLGNASDKLYSFAYSDISAIEDINSLSDMIYVGTVGIKKTIKKSTYKFFDYILSSSKSLEIIFSEENKNELLEVLKICDITDYTTEENKIIIGDKSDKKVVIGEDFISTVSARENVNFEEIPVYKILSFCSKAKSRSFAYRNVTRMFSISLIVSYLLSCVLIPNSLVQPYEIILIGGFINILSFFAIGKKRGNIHSPIMFILNICVIVFCTLGLFFAGRFFVNVPADRFDAMAVNMARTMILSFYILAVGFYNSIAVFSNLKKHKPNLALIILSVLVVVLINVPSISVGIGLVPMTAEAFKFVIFFSLVPVLINGVEGSLSGRKG